MELILKSHSRSHTCHISPVDLPIFESFKWQAVATDKKRQRYYVLARSEGRYVYLHRLILKAPKRLAVDHVNGNGLDNRRENLRLCTRFQNSQNSVGWSRRKCPFKGVSKIKRATGRKGGNPWEARICWEGKQRVIGVFKTAYEAALAYDDCARTFHGAYARLNFPMPRERGIL